jgi:hypothetical protein
MEYTSIFLVLEDIRQDIIDQYEGKKIKASGNFEKDLTIQRLKNKAILALPFYANFICKINGKKPGRQPGEMEPKPYNKIIEWMKAKRVYPRNELRQFVKRTPSNYLKSAGAIIKKIERQGTDIWMNKRQPIDIDKITANAFDYRKEQIGKRILEKLK